MKKIVNVVLAALLITVTLVGCVRATQQPHCAGGRPSGHPAPAQPKRM